MATLGQWNDLAPGPDLDRQIAIILSILFEHSVILDNKVSPDLAKQISDPSFLDHPKSYHDLIDLAASHIQKLEVQDRTAFIAGHPRIGEVSNLSAMSAAEQASRRTSPEVLHQLEQLNTAYEKAYPGLRYITFVNGRTRAEIVPELEGVLGFTGGVENYKPEPIVVHQVGSQEWEAELDRAVHDVILIAKARLIALGLN